MREDLGRNRIIRPLPLLTPENTPFWTGGAHGQLLVAHCDACDHAIHPPELVCPVCLSRTVTPRAARGTGVIFSWTINRQAWSPETAEPFALAIVSLDGETGVRITARLIDCDLTTIAIGDRVEVTFEEDRGIWFPLFRPLRVQRLTG